MAMRTDDVRALAALVEKLERCRRSPSRRDGNELIHGTVRADGNRGHHGFTRRGENLLAHAREYLTAVSALEREEDGRAFQDGPHGRRGGAGGFGTIDSANGDCADHRYKHMDTSGHDMTTPPLSPPSDSVLVGVLRRENASLLAKVRRLEEEAKRTDDKSAWGEEHLARRLKALEAQCAEAIADKTRLETKYAEVLTERDHLKIERDEAVATKDRLEIEYMEAVAAKDRAETQRVEAIAEKRRLEGERDEAIAEKSRLEIKYSESVAETDRRQVVQDAQAVAETTRLQMQCAEVIAENGRLKAQYAEATKENDRLKKQYAEAITEKDRLDVECVHVAKEKVRLETQCVEALTEKDILKIQYEKMATEKDHIENQLAEVVAEKDRLEKECATERAIADELRATIACLQLRLADTERSLSEAKDAAVAMETQLTRAKRSDTMETSGTDSDDSEAPTRLSLRVLAIKDDCEPGPEIDADAQRTGRSRTRSGDSFSSHHSEASARRRTAQRGRSSMSSTDSRKSQSSTPLDPSRPCSRSRCAQVNQLASPSKSDTFRHPLRASFHIGSPAPSCVSIDEPSEATGRCRPSSAQQSRVSSHQSNETRPRWRW